MRKYNDAEIIRFLTGIWKDEDCRFEKISFKILENSASKVRVEISRMYDPPGLSFEILERISRFFETEKLGDERFSDEGCESCDYGSKYGFVLEVKGAPDVK